jgi:adenylate cyclase
VKGSGPCPGCSVPAILRFEGTTPAQWTIAGRAVIGRGEGADVRLPDREVSKVHAAIELRGGWRIHDLGSSNGTFLNGRRVREHAPLHDGDEVRVGAIRLRFRTGAGASLAALASAPGGGSLTVVLGQPAIVAAAPVDPEARFRPAAEITDTISLRRDYERLRVAHTCHRALAGLRRPEEIAAKLLEVALAALPADAGAVVRRRGDGGAVEPLAARGRSGAADVAVSATLLGRVLAGREAVLCDDALADGAFDGAASIVGRGVRSVLAVPLAGAGPSRGALLLESGRARAFEPKDLEVVAAVAAQASIALENAELSDARDRLARFLPPTLVDEAGRGDLGLGAGARLEATALFADLRGFTALAEKLAPEETVGLLNVFFEAMVEEVFAAGGVLDKFLGDGVLALFGVPGPVPDAGAGAAIRCALRMEERLAALSSARAATGATPLAMGVGLDTGPLVVGAMGCVRRLDYTAIGDAVNVAARLCAAAGDGILCGEATAGRAPTAELDPVAPLGLKGKARPVRAFRVRGAPRAPS